jgi:hypothetical protein
MKKKENYEKVKETYITKREAPTMSTENRRITLIDSDDEDQKVNLKVKIKNTIQNIFFKLKNLACFSW